MLREKVVEDLKQAMLAKDELKVSTLRMLKAAIMKFEVSGKEKVEASDDDVLSLIKKEAKARKDSIQQFRDGGRDEMAEKEEAELAILEEYLPEQMGEDQVKEVVAAVIAETGASSMADMGKVMGAAMGKLGGQADGGVVNKVVKELLS